MFVKIFVVDTVGEDNKDDQTSATPTTNISYFLFQTQFI
jgi:hypothetical protein